MPDTQAKLHVIYDPYCGWCYGAAPLVEASRGIEGLDVELHGGGMLAGNARRQMTAELREFILAHDTRIQAMTGQKFGDGYHALLNDTSLWLDSTPPTMAILAARRFGRELDMLHQVQTAHFVEGKRIGEAGVLIALAEELQMDREAFTMEFAACMQAPGTHIRESREMLARVGGQGFPTFVLERENFLAILPNAQYLGTPLVWRQFLEHKV